MALDIEDLLLWAGLIVAIAAVALLLRADATRAANRRLAAVIVLEAMMLKGLDAALPFLQPWITEGVGEIVFVVVASLLGVSYLRLLSLLDVRALRPFDGRVGAICLVAVPLAFATIDAVLQAVFPRSNPDSISGPLMGVNVVLGSVVGLIVAAISYRRSVADSEARARAWAFVRAFGARDIIWLLVFVFEIMGETRVGSVTGAALGDLLISVNLLVYVPLVVYGVLQTQLFDIDARVRWTIQRGTVASIVIAAFFVLEKLVENVTSRSGAWLMGSILAGLLVFLAPRLNRLADKIAGHAAKPAGESSDLARFRRFDAYRDAYLSMREAGAITPKDRDALARLRARLGISEDDAAALEADVHERAGEGAEGAWVAPT